MYEIRDCLDAVASLDINACPIVWASEKKVRPCYIRKPVVRRVKLSRKLKMHDLKTGIQFKEIDRLII